MNKISRQYRFGHTTIEIRMPEIVTVPENMKIFEVQSNNTEKIYDLEVTSDLRPYVQEFQTRYPNAQYIRRKNMQILYTGEAECRLIHIEGVPYPYAVHIEDGSSTVRAWISEEILPAVHIDTIFGSILGMEKLMLQYNQMILHSAYLCHNGKAILFSAPSETGKSTQAGLWEKYRGAKQINGDKSLLLKEDSIWHAYGWPVCGSSEICHNESYPIQAIVMLFQAKENTIRRLNPSEAIKKLITQITINMWNSSFQLKALDLIQDLVMDIPVYELGCNISEDAVACLEKAL